MVQTVLTVRRKNTFLRRPIGNYIGILKTALFAHFTRVKKNIYLIQI